MLHPCTTNAYKEFTWSVITYNASEMMSHMLVSNTSSYGLCSPRSEIYSLSALWYGITSGESSFSMSALSAICNDTTVTFPYETTANLLETIACSSCGLTSSVLEESIIVRDETTERTQHISDVLHSIFSLETFRMQNTSVVSNYAPSSVKSNNLIPATVKNNMYDFVTSSFEQSTSLTSISYEQNFTMLTAIELTTEKNENTSEIVFKLPYSTNIFTEFTWNAKKSLGCCTRSCFSSHPKNHLYIPPSLFPPRLLQIWRKQILVLFVA